MAGVKMLESGYWVISLRLNLAGPTFISTVVGLLFLLLAPVQCQLNVNGRDFATTVEEGGGLHDAVKVCEYTCPEGNQRVKKPGYVSSTNGCGAYGFQLSVEEYPAITVCCNEHDNCYGTCGSDKDLCDEQLKNCVNVVCASVTDNSFEPICHLLSLAMYGATEVLGCPAFLTAQQKACLCQP